MFDCRAPYNPGAYASLVKEERSASSRTVYATVFFAGAGAYAGYLACGSSSGALSVWNLDDALGRARAADASGDDDAAVLPRVIVDAHDGAVYSVVSYEPDAGDADSRLLCTAGEDGVTNLYRVADLVSAACDASGSTGGVEGDRGRRADVRPVASFTNPQESRGRGALGPVPETTALAADATRGILFAAGGDGVTYGWDVTEGKKSPAFALKGHADALHCVASRGSCNQAVTGSEDGTARIFDVKSGKCTQVIDVWRAKGLGVGESGVGVGGGAWVGCVGLDKAENWAALGCGGRCVTMWSFAAGACASRSKTEMAPQTIKLTGEHVTAAGAEPAVYRWKLSGQLVSRQPCTPSSVFSLDMQNRGLTAVGGTGATVDLFSELGTRVCTLTCP